MQALQGAYDFKLDISSTEYGFILAAEEGVKQFTEGLAPALAPQVRDTAFGYEHTDPSIDTVMAFEEWPAGAGWEDAEPPHNPLAGGTRGIESHRYNYTRGVDLSWGRGVLSPELQTGATTVSNPTKFIRSNPLGHFAAAGQYIRYWTGSAWSESDDAGSGLAYSDLEEYVTSSGHFLLGALGGGSTKEQYKYTGPVISHQSTGTGSTTSPGTSLTVTAPATISDDDILLAFVWRGAESVGTDVSETITLPSGFTQIEHAIDVASPNTRTALIVAWKRASSESGNYAFSGAVSSYWHGAIGAYSGCVTSGSPIEDSDNVTDSTSDTAFTFPALTAISAANTLLVYGVGAQGNFTMTEASGYTERADLAHASAGTLETAEKQVGDGPQPSSSATASGSDTSLGAHVALTPQSTLTWTQSTLEDESVSIKYWTVRGISSAEPVLWGITETGKIRNSTDPTNSGSWSSADQIGSLTETVNGMRTLDDDIYIFKAEGIYKYDGSTVTFLWPARELYKPTNGKHHTIWVNKKLYVNYGGQIIEITPDNSAGDALRVVWPLFNSNAELNGDITAIAPAFDGIYFALKNAAGNTYIWKMNPATGEAHTIAYRGSADCDAMLVTDDEATDDGNQFSSTNPVLLVGDDASGDYFILTCPGENPWDCSAYRFDTSQGTAVGPFVWFGTKAFSKFLSRGEIVGDDLDANDTITLQYQTPGGSATTITTANSDGLTAADEADEVQSNLIRYVLLFDNGANTTTPILDGIALHASPVIPRKKIWRPRVLIDNDLPLLNGARNPVSASEYLTTLDNSVNARMTLTDPFGRTHTVRLIDFQGVGIVPFDYGGYQGHATAYDLVLVGLDTL